MIERTDKPWGWEELLEVNEHYAVKKIHYFPSKRTSLQHHERKTESAYVLEGVVRVEVVGEDRVHTLVMQAGATWHFPPMTIHRVTGGRTGGTVLEVSTPDLEDVVRWEDDYGRSPGP